MYMQPFAIAHDCLLHRLSAPTSPIAAATRGIAAGCLADVCRYARAGREARDDIRSGSGAGRENLPGYVDMLNAVVNIYAMTSNLGRPRLASMLSCGR
jgi:hypothetical protein